MTRAGDEAQTGWLTTAYSKLIAPARPARVAPLRREAAQHAFGHVLELGTAAGSNLGFYDWSKVDTLALAEPDKASREELRPSIQSLSSEIRSRVQLHEASPEELPFADGVFDCAIVTLALSAARDMDGALTELRRVLKPGGELRVVEQVSASGGLGTAKRIVQPALSRLAGDRHLDRNLESDLRKAGFSVQPADVSRSGSSLFPVLSAVARNPDTTARRPMPARAMQQRRRFLKRRLYVLDRHFLRRPDRYVAQALLATITLGAVIAIEDALTNAAIVTAIASSAFIIFMAPHSTLAGPRRVIGGHTVGVIVGLCADFVAYDVLGEQLDSHVVVSLTAAAGVGVTMLIMSATDTEHPPAAGTVLGLVLAPNALGNGVLVLAAAGVLSIVRVVFKRWLIDLAH